MRSSRTGPWAVAWVVAMVAGSVAGFAIIWMGWRCPACGKWPGEILGHFNYCGRCAIPLAEGVSPRSEQAPARAEWVVATLRRRCWWVRGTLVLALGGGGLLGWCLQRAGMRPLGVGIFSLGILGWALLVRRVWRCPECEAPLEGHDVRRFCTRCGVPHNRKGLERVRPQA
jgi:hypothetical protein